MDAHQLRALQAPLKETYRNRPEAAVVTLRAQGRIGEGLSCRVETGKALAEATRRLRYLGTNHEFDKHNVNTPG